MDDISISRLDSVPVSFEGELAQLWLAVSQAGGAVGFGLEVEPGEVAAAARSNAEAARARRTRFVVLRCGERLAGIVKLEPGTDPVVRHRAMLKLLMVDPELQGHGWGTRLVGACLDLAREMGIEQVYLSARSRTGLEEYYRRIGWREVGRFPGGVRVAEGDDRDEVWFFRNLVDPP